MRFTLSWAVMIFLLSPSLPLAEQAAAKEINQPKAAAKGKEIRGKDGAPMVLVPAGEFLMGSNEALAKPVHPVSLDAFYLDQYEVTNALFEKFIRDTGHKTAAEKAGKTYTFSSGNKEVIGANWRKPEGRETVFASNRETHPVVVVSWLDAEAYCRWAGKRLPTEAEFEYANRGRTTTRYWWGDGLPKSRRVANMADESLGRKFPSDKHFVAGYDDGYAQTAPVGSFDPNPFGLYDMTGNVWEWTADWFEPYQNSPSRNPMGPSSGEFKIIRGGAWNSNDVFGLHPAARLFDDPTARFDDITGFRCARTP